MNMPTGGYHTGTGFQKRYNAADTFGGSAGQGNDGFTSFTECGTPHKIHLPSNPTVLFRPD